MKHRIGLLLHESHDLTDALENYLQFLFFQISNSCHLCLVHVYNMFHLHAHNDHCSLYLLVLTNWTSRHKNYQNLSVHLHCQNCMAIVRPILFVLDVMMILHNFLQVNGQMTLGWFLMDNV